MATQDPTARSAIHQLKALGENPLPPTILATLTTALHLRPFQPLPMLFPPVFLFATYANIQGMKTDAAGISAAWSAAYLILARRRSPVEGLRGKFTARGGVRGLTMALCAAEVVAGGTAYVFGRREKEELAGR